MRAGHRSSTTRLMRQLEGEYEIDDGPSLERLMQCKLSLNEKLDRLRTLDDEILTLVVDEDIESESEQTDQFKERIHQAIFYVQHSISAKQCRTSTVSPSTGSTLSVSSSTTATAPDTGTVASSDSTVPTTDVISPTSHTPDTGATTIVTTTTVTPLIHHDVAETSSSRVKLPKIEPKKFNGDLTKWETFWSSFESSIHLNAALTAVDKFHYLSSLLEGPAFAAVAGLKLTAPNYAEAIDTLTKRYGNKQLIIARHMDTLLELKPVTSPTNIKALRRLHDQIEFQVRSLKSLEVPLDSYGNLLSSLFMNRLPHEFRLLVSREVGEAEWRIDDIMTIVGREIGARERAFLPTTRSVPTATALVAGDGNPRCCYCRQLHSSVSCKTVTDVVQRKSMLKKAGRCFVCLKRHHVSRDCCSPVSCALCNRCHHTSICIGNVSSHANQPTNNQPAPANSNIPTGSFTPRTNQTTATPPSTPQASTSAAPHTPTTTTGLYCVNVNTPVLLQTAQAYIYKLGDPNCGMVIRLILDGGSQRSYVTQRVKDALELQQNIQRKCTYEHLYQIAHDHRL